MSISWYLGIKEMDLKYSNPNGRHAGPSLIGPADRAELGAGLERARSDAAFQMRRSAARNRHAALLRRLESHAAVERAA
jgi:hypothetical protein